MPAMNQRESINALISKHCLGTAAGVYPCCNAGVDVYTEMNGWSRGSLCKPITGGRKALKPYLEKSV